MASSSAVVDTSNDLAEVPLAGYTDRLSARPGDTIRFYLSSLSAKQDDLSLFPSVTTVSAKLTRSICADPNPKGPGIIEEDASQWFSPQVIKVPYQRIPRGSYAQTKSKVCLRLSSSGRSHSVDISSEGTVFDSISKISVTIWFYPSLIHSNEKSSFSMCVPSCQTLWQWGNWGRVTLDSTSGHLEASLLDRVGVCRAPIPLKSHRWYHIIYTLGMEENKIHTCNLKVDVKQDLDDRVYHHTSTLKRFVPAKIFSDIEAPFDLAMDGTLNGRLEDPTILVTGTLASSSLESKLSEEHEFVSWKTSVYSTGQDLDPWTVPCHSTILPKSNCDEYCLVLYHHPTRAVKGRKWNGSELCWRHDPNQYGAIHFHDDDVYDFQWSPTLEWVVPEGLPSGIYIMRFNDDNQNQEALPTFICPPKVSRNEINSRRVTTKKLAVVIPTFTYVMYGNHARPDFEKDSWSVRCHSSPGSYPHNPAMYPAYGLSTYNFHSDFSGIHFASHLRPLFNLRPGYITFSRVGGYMDDNPITQGHYMRSYCSGLRHFPADSHLIAWLHHHGIDYDIVTDHELHREGMSVLASFTTIMTTSHPEYHTLESLKAYQQYRDDIGGNLIYLGGNGFYWRIAASPRTDIAYDDSCKLLEIRRCESGVRTWAAGMFDGSGNVCPFGLCE
jgi:N,N-dimethylformamidase